MNELNNLRGDKLLVSFIWRGVWRVTWLVLVWEHGWWGWNPAARRSFEYHREAELRCLFEPMFREGVKLCNCRAEPGSNYRRSG